MSNPPDWVKRTKLAESNLNEIKGMNMAGVSAGVVGAAEVNSQPSRTGGASLQSPATWTSIWFLLALFYLLGVYYGYVKLNASS